MIPSVTMMPCIASVHLQCPIDIRSLVCFLIFRSLYKYFHSLPNFCGCVCVCVHGCPQKPEEGAVPLELESQTVWAILYGCLQHQDLTIQFWWALSNGNSLHYSGDLWGLPEKLIGRYSTPGTGIFVCVNNPWLLGSFIHPFRESPFKLFLLYF